MKTTNWASSTSVSDSKCLSSGRMQCVSSDTLIYKGEPVSLSSEVGILTLMHGALQSAIGTVDEAISAENAYKLALVKVARGR